MRTPLHAALAALLALACGSDEDEDEVVETVEVRGEQLDRFAMEKRLSS